MNKYSIKLYEQGFDKEQARIGFEVASSWLWPLAHDEQDLKRIHSQPNFDPESSLYCFDGNQMVGFISIDFIGNKRRTCFWTLKNADFADSKKGNLRFLRESASRFNSDKV